MAGDLPRFLQTRTYYVFQTSRSGIPFFCDPACCEFYLLHLSICLRAFRLQLHGFVFLPDQQHLLVTPFSRDGIGRLLGAVNRTYEEYFLNRFARRSALDSHRYRYRLLDSDALVLDSQKFIELLPVEECLVNNIGEYPWSSYPVNAFGGDGGYLVRHRAHRRFLGDGPDRFRKYREFIAAGFNADQRRFMIQLLQLGYPIKAIAASAAPLQTA